MYCSWFITCVCIIQWQSQAKCEQLTPWQCVQLYLTTGWHCNNHFIITMVRDDVMSNSSSVSVADACATSTNDITSPTPPVATLDNNSRRAMSLDRQVTARRSTIAGASILPILHFCWWTRHDIMVYPEQSVWYCDRGFLMVQDLMYHHTTPHEWYNIMISWQWSHPKIKPTRYDVNSVLSVASGNVLHLMIYVCSFNSVTCTVVKDNSTSQASNWEKGLSYNMKNPLRYGLVIIR